MSDRPKDGGPAFPRQGVRTGPGPNEHAFMPSGIVDQSVFGHFVNPQLQEQTGMSLRDYFAAAAIQPLVQSHMHVSGRFASTAQTVTSYASDDEVARRAYAIADAMLKAREGGQ